MEALERETQSAQEQARQAIAEAKRQVQEAMSRKDESAAMVTASILTKVSFIVSHVTTYVPGLPGLNPLSWSVQAGPCPSGHQH
eukprot:1159346-Pelagomonas_calceolata.AAC.6